MNFDHFDTDKKVIDAFNKIRDEPLDIIKNRCWEKSKKLKETLENLGYKVRFGLCSFRWSSQKFPKDILKFPHEDRGYHLFLWVRIAKDYLLVDPSNDSLLPEYNEWDGLTNCKLGVIPEEIFNKNKDNKLEEKEKIENKNYKKYNKFYEGVNKFLERVRKK